MKLSEIKDDVPLVIALAQNLLKKGEYIEIEGDDGIERPLTMIAQRPLDDKWVLRGTSTSSIGTTNSRDTRIPADADIDDILKLKKIDTGWILMPDWQKMFKLGI